MATKWVSLDKLRYAISKIHTLLQGKVDKVDGKGLSANDLTAALKGNYDAAYTHSQADHAPAAAEKNIIVLCRCRLCYLVLYKWYRRRCRRCRLRNTRCLLEDNNLSRQRRTFPQGTRL